MLTMKKALEPSTPPMFNPWPDAPPSSARRRDPAVDGPHWWPLLSIAARGAIGGHAVALLAAHPTATRDDAARLAFQLWDRVRALKPNGRHTVEAELHSPEVGTTGVLHLADVLRALLAAGDVLATLRVRRDALDEQIRRLETIRGSAA